MLIATFNAASIRARLPLLLDWLAENEPDVLAVQETKVEDDKFPLEPFQELGYFVEIHGQKAYNGVALLSRDPMTGVRKGFEDEAWPNDCRIISANIGGIEFINTYVPNGTKVGTDKWDYKLRWYDRFAQMLRERYSPDQPLVWMGDINVAPEPIDVFDHERMLGGVCHHPDEFARLKNVVDFGLTELFRMHHPEAGHYTYWEFTIPNALDRGLGWRIDHIYVTAPLVSQAKKCWIDVEARRLVRPSDHTFVLAKLSKF